MGKQPHLHGEEKRTDLYTAPEGVQICTDPGHDHSGHNHAGPDTADHDHADHDHSGHGHDHAPKVDAGNERRILFVLIMTAGYALVQAVAGVISGSLALIADAGHMVSDALALALALVAYRIARRAADATASYGWHRVRVLAALANGATLLLLVAWIAWEAVQRLTDPVEVLAGPMLVVAVIGLCVNLLGAWILMRGDRGDGNLRGAFLHVLGDLLGSVGAILASLGIMFTGWMPLDPILSVLVAMLVLRSAWALVADSVLVLIQTTPKGLDTDALLADLRSLPGVAEAEHLHAWTLTDQSAVATLHVSPAPGADPLALPGMVRARLAQAWGIEHVTVEVNAPGQIPRDTG